MAAKYEHNRFALWIQEKKKHSKIETVVGADITCPIIFNFYKVNSWF